MNNEELKKEYDSLDIIHWSWIEKNFVSKSEHEMKLAIKDDAIRAYDMYSNYILGEIKQLKAENEKLGKVVSESAKLLTDNIIDVAEARKETKKAIEKVLMKRLMDGSIDFISINATQLSEEFDKAIEPQPSENKIGD